MKLNLTKESRRVQVVVLLVAAAVFLVTWVYPLVLMALGE